MHSCIQKKWAYLCDSAETVVCWAPRLVSCRVSVMTHVAVTHLSEMEKTEKFIMYQWYWLSIRLSVQLRYCYSSKFLFTLMGEPPYMLQNELAINTFCQKQDPGWHIFRLKRIKFQSDVCCKSGTLFENNIEISNVAKEKNGR